MNFVAAGVWCGCACSARKPGGFGGALGAAVGPASPGQGQQSRAMGIKGAGDIGLSCDSRLIPMQGKCTSVGTGVAASPSPALLSVESCVFSGSTLPFWVSIFMFFNVNYVAVGLSV